jgi:hypothetical protein
MSTLVIVSVDPDLRTPYPEAGKGEPRWQPPGGALLPGIDRTAIMVDGTDRSLGFCRDRLGMDVAGERKN